MIRWARLAAVGLFASTALAGADDRLSVVLDWLVNPDEASLFLARHEGFSALTDQPQLDAIASPMDEMP